MPLFSNVTGKSSLHIVKNSGTLVYFKNYSTQLRKIAVIGWKSLCCVARDLWPVPMVFPRNGPGWNSLEIQYPIGGFSRNSAFQGLSGFRFPGRENSRPGKQFLSC